MGKTIAQKIIAAHLVTGDMTVGSEIALKIDQTLTRMPPAPWLTWNLRPWVFPRSRPS